ncbi:MAG TPA: alpha/beta fold hydrolase [Bryobacteraceae bacterium]|jgi:hypothetical protein|nr:alpha/beta fold hydrolase [Bryobacteraceae bacterium]
MSRIESFTSKSESSPDVTGFLHIPDAPNNHGLVLTHGAGANCETPLLTSIARTFADTGFHVLRCDLPFRQRKKSGPPHPSQAADDRNGLRAAVAALRSRVHGNIFLGGHSYGGRQASILASEDATIAKGLLLLSYPLHPPDKPSQLRTGHFPGVQIPALFVHGTKDPFATVDELRAALPLIPAQAKLSILGGAAHDLKRGKFDIAANVVAPFSELFRRGAGRP